MFGTTRGLPQRRDAHAGAQEHAGHVDCDELVPFGHGDVLDPLADEYAGVVDQDVQRAEPADRDADGGGPAFFLGHVQMYVFGLSPGGADGGDGLHATLIQHVANHHLGTGLGH